MCVSVSDGSLKDKDGTTAWTTESETGVLYTGEDIPPTAESRANRCTGVNIAPGAPTVRSAYHSEVARIFGNAAMICERDSITSPRDRLAWVLWYLRSGRF
jgi:hypothetical protein